MHNAWITGLLWFSVVGCGLMAGVSFDGSRISPLNLQN